MTGLQSCLTDQYVSMQNHEVVNDIGFDGLLSMSQNSALNKSLPAGLSPAVSPTSSTQSAT